MTLNQISEIHYELIRSRRKSIAIYVKDCRVIVRAPLIYPVRGIDRFVESKKRWIEKHLIEQQKQAEYLKNFKLTYGSDILFLGQKYRIVDVEGIDDTFYCPPGLGETQIRKKLISFYKDHANKIIPELIDQIAPIIGARPTDIRIGSAKRSWGSCTSAGKVTFSWRLMMASPESIEYVVVHELAHLKQLNHSEKFWAVVARVLPDWKKRRKALRGLQKNITV